ncbi:asparagine synthase-related protein [Evansella clarkii]|uniref:asparagine synthase-related protein n=1 Tax=Evansella clarkii TaxID=79879 RepID=UPI000998C0C4|nr:asparagine synthase-related protein [Evansella clarkii]
MSAIAGLVHFNNEAVLPKQARALMAGFEQFPADDIQTWQMRNIFLGCHAQWITPESVGEQLPYYDYNRKLAITCDAIIDNRKELFEKLHIKDPLIKRSMPDSQIILLAYDKWGEQCPKYLIGDFSFMIWDQNNQKLFGARDFSGARTLYFYNDQSRFIFSTIMETFFRFPYIKKELNESWLAEFISISGMEEAINMTETVYKSIYQVPPGHSISAKNGNVKLARYIKLDVNETIKFKSDEEYEEAFRYELDQAVSDRLRTHGGVGAQLSGGLDSSSVVSIAAKQLQKDYKKLYTYSYVPEVTFNDWTSNFYVPNESPYIKETVNFVGNINDNYLDFDGRSSLDEIDHFLDIMEMPYKFFNNSLWLKGINETVSQQGIKILLNGARGNHSISFGSKNLTITYYSDLLKRLRWIALNKELNLFCQQLNTGKRVILPLVMEKTFPIIYSFFNKEETANTETNWMKLINPDLAKNTQLEERLMEYNRVINDETSIRNNHFQQPYTWNKTGTATTKLSLRYSTWDRDPTNDLRLIKFCLAVPQEQYAKGGMERALIRRAMKGLLPDKVRLNQHSRGLQAADVVHRLTPKWPAFIEEITNMTSDPVTSHYINMDYVKNAIAMLGDTPNPEYVFYDEFKVLTRSLILHRFLKRHTS